MTETLQDLYKRIDDNEDVKLNDVEQKPQMKLKSYIPKTAYYRYVKFSYGTQGCCDIKIPLNDWKPLNKYSDKEMNEYNKFIDNKDWYELKIDIEFR